MYLYEMGARKEKRGGELADTGIVSVGGESPALRTGGEKRDASLLRPVNALRLPLEGEEQLMLRTADGECVLLGVLGGDAPSGLEAGEIYICTKNAAVTIKNDGSVNISGRLYVNGREISGT